jgi:hypothetical protein
MARRQADYPAEERIWRRRLVNGYAQVEFPIFEVKPY